MALRRAEVSAVAAALRACTTCVLAREMASIGSDLNEHLCALVSNVQTQERCLELLNGISYNYDVATYYGRILVSR